MADAPKLDLPDAITALLFDLDGVLTKTAVVHDQALEGDLRRASSRRAPRRAVKTSARSTPAPTTTNTSTARRATTACARSSNRAGSSCRGAPDDPPDAETVCGLGNRKNEMVLKLIEEDGVEPYEGSVRFVEAARAAGLRRAVVSASANCKDVLEAAGIADLFEARIDGVVADERHLAGQARAGHLPGRGRGARRRRPPPPASSRTPLAGVEAGAAGHFGHVVGVDRVRPAPTRCDAHGADIVVDDLGELISTGSAA